MFTMSSTESRPANRQVSPTSNQTNTFLPSRPSVPNQAEWLRPQNGVVNGAAEMFRLRSCVRRKRDSIDKRFCLDIEVVER